MPPNAKAVSDVDYAGSLPGSDSSRPEVVAEVSKSGPDFEWSYAEEPHRTRRALILQHHKDEVRLQRAVRCGTPAHPLAAA